MYLLITPQAVFPALVSYQIIRLSCLTTYFPLLQTPLVQTYLPTYSFALIYCLSKALLPFTSWTTTDFIISGI